MSLSSELWELVRAGFSGIWVETHEPVEAVLELSNMARERELRLLAWNLDTGMQSLVGEELTHDSRDPLSAVRGLGNISGEQSTLLVLENFHRFIDSPEICHAQALQERPGFCVTGRLE